MQICTSDSADSGFKKLMLVHDTGCKCMYTWMKIRDADLHYIQFFFYVLYSLRFTQGSLVINV